MARGLFAVLESELENEVIPAADENLERVEELEAQVAQADSDEIVAENDEMAETIEDAVTAIEELSEVSEILEDSVEAGTGLTEEAAEIAEVAVESICARLGYTPVKRVVPALESFGATSSRLDATKYALEGLGDMARKVWEAIKKFFTNLWEGFKRLWAQLTNVAVRYKASAEKQAKKLAELVKEKAEVKSADKINVAKFCFAFNEKNPANLKNVIAPSMASNSVHLLDIGDINAKLSKLSILSDEKSMKVGIKPEELGFGGKSKMALSFGYTLDFADEKGVRVDQTKVSVPNAEAEPTELAKLVLINEKVTKTCEDFEKAKSEFSKAETVVKTIIKTAEALSKKDEENTKMKEKADAFKKAGSVFSIVNSKVPSIAIKAAGMALDYVSKNMKAYGVKEEKAAAAK